VLTTHQIRVLEAASFGYDEPRTADLLGVKQSTVRALRRTIRRKLGARTFTHAVALAIRADLMA
jgi:DNA-binding CsgD family transcriptional regulator